MSLRKKISAFDALTSVQQSTVFPAADGNNTRRVYASALRSYLGPNLCVYQEATALTTSTVADIPLCDIVDLYAKVIVNGSANDGGMVVNIGIGTDATRFGTISVSARGLYRLTNVSARMLAGASGAVVAAAPGASAASNVIAGVGYFKR